MTDYFSERYGDLLTGAYDCVDRIVLNAYFSLGHNPGGFRVWWRQLHDGCEDQLDNAHLMRMAGWFARRVRASAKANGIPVIDCGRGERKHRIADEYLATHRVGPGVFLILVARAPATLWEVSRSASGRIRNLEKHSRRPNCRIDNLLSIRIVQAAGSSKPLAIRECYHYLMVVDAPPWRPGMPPGQVR